MFSVIEGHLSGYFVMLSLVEGHLRGHFVMFSFAEGHPRRHFLTFSPLYGTLEAPFDLLLHRVMPNLSGVDKI